MTQRDIYHFTAIEGGQPLPCRFFVQHGFLTPEQCDVLIDFHVRTTDKRPRTGKGFFDGRVTWFPFIPDDEPAKAIMRNARTEAIRLIREFYDIAHPMYGDSVQINDWPEGMGMPAHYDRRHPDKHEQHPMPWREYAGVVYLNDDYYGGELYINSANPPIVLKPVKGMIVIFGGGDGFMHGVHPPYGKTRYTMPCWFTSDPQRQEQENLPQQPQPQPY
jgi:predicted 2-oxoglutarate/Fe(II)-dependent dioxygenase YbiX